ncbi:MAG: hypothetical protein ACPLQP_11860 [Moorellaceae bacterium]
MAWLAAWITGGMVAELKGCLLGLLSAIVCACAIPGAATASGEKVYEVHAYYLVFLLGSMWAISKVFQLPPAPVLSAGAYLVALAMRDRVRVTLWDSGMRLPWMAAPVRGMSVEAGLELRKQLPQSLWMLLTVAAVSIVFLWTLDAVVRWWHYMDMLYSTGVLR